MIRIALLLAVVASLASGASADTVAPADTWRPMYSFLGTWKGTRTGTDGPVKVTRVYASATTNHHLEITESGASRASAVWGIVVFDPQRQGLVLRHFAANGSAADLAYDAQASTADKLVFASAATDSAPARITYERAGWNAFVERIELAGAGGAMTVVAETRFVRG